MNESAFRDLYRGECLFLGASGSQRADEKWQISFGYAGSPNVTGSNPMAVSVVTITDKLGWDYVWARFRSGEDTTNKLLKKELLYAAVHRVYQFGDFSSFST